jgi:hypothetical protein
MREVALAGLLLGRKETGVAEFALKLTKIAEKTSIIAAGNVLDTFEFVHLAISLEVAATGTLFSSCF